MHKPVITLWAALLLAASTSNPAIAQIPLNAQLKDQSAYALGTFELNVIFVESDGSIDPNQEDWTSDQIVEIQGEIDQAVGFWEGLTDALTPNAQLDIRVNYVADAVPLTTGYEPINRSSTGDSVWINQVMGDLGYQSSSKFTNVRNFNQDRRIEAGTNWAATMFIVNDLVDEDNRFTNSFFAYSHIGGPFMMLTYANDGWRPDRFNQVLSHEMAHLFFGLDEYAAAGARTMQRSGYLNGFNGNAERDGNGRAIDPPMPDSLMINNTLDLSEFTLAQVGIVDSDGDSIPDILDTVPLLSGDMLQSDSASGTFVFDGTAVVSPLDNRNTKNSGFSNSGADMTINWILAAEFNHDDLGWQSFAALDGAYDDFGETLQLTLAGLRAGQHQIAIRAVNSVGNPSATLDLVFLSTIAVPEPSAGLLLLLGVILSWGSCRLRPGSRRSWCDVANAMPAFSRTSKGVRSDSGSVNRTGETTTRYSVLSPIFEQAGTAGVPQHPERTTASHTTSSRRSDWLVSHEDLDLGSAGQDIEQFRGVLLTDDDRVVHSTTGPRTGRLGVDTHASSETDPMISGTVILFDHSIFGCRLRIRKVEPRANNIKAPRVATIEHQPDFFSRQINHGVKRPLHHLEPVTGTDRLRA